MLIDAHQPPPSLPVLLVDDDEVVRTIGAEFLERAGFEVIEAEHGDEALGVLEARPDVWALVTDVEMPGSLDGFELAHHTHRNHPSVSVIIISGRRRPAADSLPDGAVFIPKPFDPAAIVHQVRKMVFRKRP